MRFKIIVKTIARGTFLTFNNVPDYKVEDGYLIFVDTYTGQTKRFAVSNTEIEEVIEP